MSRRDDPVALALTRDLLESVAEEMAAVCIRTAVSPNVKDRRDLSAAVFDAKGVMVAHAAHIPVHLGAMPLSVRAVLDTCPLEPGDVALVNDPYAGGTHLPDITAVRAVFDPATQRRAFLVAVRAHHADVGGAVPGSMAPADDVYAEGLRIPPVRWVVNETPDPGVTSLLLSNMRDADERRGDLAAQAGALRLGERRLRELAAGAGGLTRLARRGASLVRYAGRLAAAALERLADGSAKARLDLEVDGVDGKPARVAVRLTKQGTRLTVDFSGTTGPVGMGLNAPRAVTQSAVYYFVRCLCPDGTPTNDGLMEHVDVVVPDGCLLAARPPAPVAGGNVETSQRVVDALWLAAARLWPGRVPAPGCGTMSNWTFGRAPDGPPMPSYYETIPGGAGGGPDGAGADAIQQHMTNTRGTPVEVLEARWPVRVERLALRPRSGGAGKQAGGRGVIREVRFLEPAVVSLMMTRHATPPPGVAGGKPGRAGRVTLVRGGRARRLDPRARVDIRPGDVLRIETPGGGGWGRP
ncbi:MAG: hydantoinase B/oxoprolinase family protein [Planctomycetota bacterium]|nr:hydantoinase B/oxoprolinase family protein [Planctomycetota bacterium]